MRYYRLPMRTTGYSANSCYLCGNSIDAAQLSWDHVPPLQFFPKQLRAERNLNLWVAPTHKRCNEDYRKDEEYFYHVMSAPVGRGNPSFYRIMHGDFARRAHKPQTPAMMRSILKTITTVTPGGIHLPRGLYQVMADEWRLNRVVIKIARGLFCLDHARFMPEGNCFDLRFCDEAEKIPEVYQFKHPDQPKGACCEVFSYTHFDFDGKYFWVLCFWEAFAFCTAFADPRPVK